MPIVVEVKKGEEIKFSQAREDIEVYKILVMDKNKVLLSMFNNNINWNLKVKYCDIGIFDRQPAYRTKNKEYLISNTGLYSFATERAARRFQKVYSDAKQFVGKELWLIKATIPKGSIYYKHKDQIISDALSLKKS